MAIPRNLANIAPHMNASSTELVVNDGGANLDFRVEGDTDANLLLADASADRIGIGTSSPTGKLDVSSSGAGVTAGDFVVDTANKTVYVGRQSSTNADNSTFIVRNRVGTEVMTVDASTQTVKTASTVSVGNATPAASGAGITFPATQSASSDANTLDDYEEGTWTPVITYGGVTNTSYYDRAGKYTKIGNTVAVQLYVEPDTIINTGDMLITSLPFTCYGSATKEHVACSLCFTSYGVDAIGAFEQVTAQVRAGTSTIMLFNSRSGTNAFVRYTGSTWGRATGLWIAATYYI